MLLVALIKVHFKVLSRGKHWTYSHSAREENKGIAGHYHGCHELRFADYWE